MRPASRTLALSLAACALAGGCRLNTAVLQKGANSCTGQLFNLSCGARPCDPIDPCKPTIVFIHGWNPLPNKMRCTFGPSSAAALRRRCGSSYNILSWDWNNVRVRAFNDEPIRIGKEQGRMMAAALRCRGVIPCRTQIIGHSLGTLATAQAAVCLRDLGPFAQLTLLDPPASMHHVVFDELCVTHHARWVENYYAPGFSGYGEHVSRPNVQNYIVPGEHPIIGVVDLSRSSHVHVMEWYYWTIACPDYFGGFQRSVFLKYCGCRCPFAPPCYEETYPIEESGPADEGGSVEEVAPDIHISGGHP